MAARYREQVLSQQQAKAMPLPESEPEPSLDVDVEDLPSAIDEE